MSLLFNTLSRFVIVFLPRSKCLLTSWLQWLIAVILKPLPRPQIKSVNASTFPPSICHEVMGLDAMILIFWMLSFRLVLIHSSISFSSTGSLVPLPFLPLGWYHLHIWGYWYFSLFPAGASSSPEFCMMHPTYKLNKGDNIQPWCTPFPILSQSAVPYPFLTVASWIQVSQVS